MKKLALLSFFLVTLLVALQISFASTFNKPVQRILNDFALNWAGYVVTSGPYSSASATWTVPTIQTTSTGYSSAWIGIGGFNGNTVIQTGTEQDCLSSGTTAGEMRYHGFANSVSDNSINNGKSGGGSKSTSCNSVYYAWWELYPQNAEQSIPSCSTSVTSQCITVSKGDSITASVTQINATSWTLTITDTTNGQTFSTTQTPTFVPDQGSAEAIIERPALCFVTCKLTNLANFGTIPFSSVSSSTTFPDKATSITMIDNSFKIMAQPGPISSGAFTVTWLRSN